MAGDNEHERTPQAQQTADDNERAPDLAPVEAPSTDRTMRMPPLVTKKGAFSLPSGLSRDPQVAVWTKGKMPMGIIVTEWRILGETSDGYLIAVKASSDSESDSEVPGTPPSEDLDAGQTPHSDSANSALAPQAGDDGETGDPEPVAIPNAQTDSTEPPATILTDDLDAEVLPVMVYLVDAAPAAGVEKALENALAAFGGAVVLREPPVVRSWFRRMGVRFHHAAGSDAVRRLGRELDRAVELRAVDEVQAKVDASQGEAVAKLLTALVTTPTALIQIGSVLLVKVNGTPVVRNLTQTELVYLQRNPDTVRDPAACLDALQHLADRGSGGDQASVGTHRAAGLADSTASLPGSIRCRRAVTRRTGSSAQ